MEKTARTVHRQSPAVYPYCIHMIRLAYQCEYITHNSYINTSGHEWSFLAAWHRSDDIHRSKMERKGQPHDITKDGWLPSPTHPLQPPYCWDQDRILHASLTNTHFGYLAQDKEHIHAIPDAVLTDPGHARFGKSHLSRHRMSGTRSVESTSAKLSKDISFLKITF